MTIEHRIPATNKNLQALHQVMTDNNMHNVETITYEGFLHELNREDTTELWFSNRAAEFKIYPVKSFPGKELVGVRILNFRQMKLKDLWEDITRI